MTSLSISALCGFSAHEFPSLRQHALQGFEIHRIIFGQRPADLPSERAAQDVGLPSGTSLGETPLHLHDPEFGAILALCTLRFIS
jgi:hypothetical protein